MDGWSGREKKSDLKIYYEPWVLKDFSGYLCIDEVYDGPYAIYYAVDPVTQKRVAFQISDKASEEETRRFCLSLREMGLAVKAVTTDGSHIYPRILAEIFPQAKHQICRFHILKEINLLILSALSQFRRSLPKPPKRPRGHPRKGEEKRLTPEEILAEEVWTHRYDWTRRMLSDAERRCLRRIWRGYPVLRAIRDLVDLIHDLFDRRCRMDTALAKLRRLRDQRIFGEFPQLLPIWKKLQSKKLAQALEYLDDELLDGTSNAVERANRSHRKIQKSVYRVRSRKMIRGRIILDMLIEKEKRTRLETLAAFHHATWSRFTIAA